MKNKNINKLLAISILVLITLYFCVAIIHFKIEGVHNDDCFVCTLIHSINEKIDSFNPSMFNNLVIFTMIIFVIKNAFDQIVFNKKCNTLIGLKVELLD